LFKHKNPHNNFPSVSEIITYSASLHLAKTTTEILASKYLLLAYTPLRKALLQWVKSTVEGKSQRSRN